MSNADQDLPIKAKLVRLHSTNDRLRTREVVGTCMPPVEGEQFRIFAEPIDESADVRYVETSFVLGVVKGSKGCWRFRTLNSEYELTTIEGDRAN